MRTVETREIDELYKKCGVEGSSSNYVRTRINTGTMGNKLNTGNLFGGLEEIGMERESYETVYARRYWDEMYETAKKYAAEHGSIHDVPHNHVTEDGKKLGQWISQQRGIRKGTRKHSIEMTAEPSTAKTWKRFLHFLRSPMDL